jgi:S1-C subfamily serine protease
VIVTDVHPSGLGAKLDIRLGDSITHVNGHKVDSAHQFYEHFWFIDDPTHVKIRVNRKTSK